MITAKEAKDKVWFNIVNGIENEIEKCIGLRKSIALFTIQENQVEKAKDMLQANGYVVSVIGNADVDKNVVLKIQF